MAASAFPVRVRMYRQGLGDCFLLSFGKGQAQRHVMIDCGTLGATTSGVKMKEVAESIRDTVGAPGKHLDLLIATHEHKDHVSGFGTDQPTFDQITADHVWLAWTENSEDELAKQIAKYKGDLIKATKLAARALTTDRFGAGAAHEGAQALGAGVLGLLAFVDEDELRDEDLLGATLAKTVNDAMAYVQKKAPRGLEFHQPGEVLEPDWLPGVRVYVLGPPRSKEALANLGKRGSEELYELAARRGNDLVASAGLFASGQSPEEYYAGLDAEERADLERVRPFDSRHRVDAKGAAGAAQYAAYFGADDGWRRIDHDWLDGAAELALQLDGQTNNTSLALAFELIEPGRVGRVLLFPADAQVGNWLSWHTDEKGSERAWEVTDRKGKRRVTARDLLAATVLYKVGHHASHNATVREHGLEMMRHDDLVALIPVDRAVALKKTPPWLMPARGLFKRLLEKASGRVVRSDVGWAARDEKEFPKLFPAAEWKTFASAQQEAEETGQVKIERLFVEWTLGR